MSRRRARPERCAPPTARGATLSPRSRASPPSFFVSDGHFACFAFFMGSEKMPPFTRAGPVSLSTTRSNKRNHDLRARRRLDVSPARRGKRGGEGGRGRGGEGAGGSETSPGARRDASRDAPSRSAT